jgi:hypothetical protein
MKLAATLLLLNGAQSIDISQLSQGQIVEQQTSNITTRDDYITAKDELFVTLAKI